MEKPRANMMRDLILGVAVIVLAGALMKHADLPTRVSVVETKVDDLRIDQADIKQMVHRIFERVNRR